MAARRLVVLIGAASLPAMSALAIYLAHPSARASSSPKAGSQVAGCHAVASAYGYPASYIAHPVKYKVHPPLPVAGWRAPGRALDIDVLFHSVFHGYIVITYPQDLPAADRAELRRWVMSRSGDRVVATPTRVPGAAWIDAAEWGWELRCERAVPTQADLDRFAAHRKT
jgi:Protein of unknown function (DUF3105)